MNFLTKQDKSDPLLNDGLSESATSTEDSTDRSSFFSQLRLKKCIDPR